MESKDIGEVAMRHKGFSVNAIRRLAIVCAASGLMVAFGSAGPKTQTEVSGPGNWLVSDAAVYENLSLFPVLSRKGADTSSFITLDEALTSGDAVVTERGGDTLRRTRGANPSLRTQQAGSGAQVNQLVLVHRGTKPLILLAGEVVTGGKQDRVIAKDRIVPPGADPLPLDVFCVERGRWAGASTQFAAAKMMVHPSVREKAVVDRDQSEVWAAVRTGGIRSAETGIANAGVVDSVPMGVVGGVLGSVISREAQSESYAKIYGSEQVSAHVEAFVDEMARRFARATAGLKQDRVVGIVVAYGGELAWADVFASNPMFDRYWTKLLRSYTVEALARPTLKEKTSLEDARAFLRPLAGRETVESEPGVYRWRQVVQGNYTEIGLESLGAEPMTLHWCKAFRTTR